MQWSSDLSSVKPWLPMHPNHKIKNVEQQLNDQVSHLKTFIDLIQMRKSLPILQWGKLEMHLCNEKIFSFLRFSYDYPTYLVVMNLSAENVNTDLLIGTDIAPRAYVVYYLEGTNIKSVAEPTDSQKAKKEVDLTELYKKNEPVLTKNVFLKGYDCLVLTWHSTN